MSVTVDYNVLYIVIGFVLITYRICKMFERINRVDKDFTLSIEPCEEEEDKQ